MLELENKYECTTDQELITRCHPAAGSPALRKWHLLYHPYSVPDRECRHDRHLESVILNLKPDRQ